MQRNKVKVWDIAVRVFHWLLPLLLLGAFLTADDDGTIGVHAWFGAAILGLLLLRTVWGFVGTRHARFSDFVRSPRAVWSYLRQFLRGRPPVHLGHNPLGALMVVALLGVLGLISLTGALIYLGPQWEGPLTGLVPLPAAKLLATVHEGAAELLPWLLVAHVAGVLVSSLLERQNLIAGMFTGWKRAPGARRRAGALALGLTLAGASAKAATPQALLDGWAAEQRVSEPGFAAFDPARGKQLFATEFTPKGERISCATCHTADPRGQGRTPAGKLLEPLAPSVTPDRFTDEKKVEKWFDRNCKQVLGRACTPREKGDLLSYFLSV